MVHFDILHHLCPNYVFIEMVFRFTQCPNETEKAKFIAAARRGDITWHAGPMNMYMETMDPMMVGFGVQLSIDLDKELGIKRKYRTLSQRDVPGEFHSRPSMQCFYFVYLFSNNQFVLTGIFADFTNFRNMNMIQINNMVQF